MPDVRVFTMCFNVAVPAICVEYGDNIYGVGLRERSVPFNNDEVVIIRVRRFKAKIMGASHHDRVVAERIKHDHLAVNVNDAGTKKSFFPVVKYLLDVVRYEDIVAEALADADPFEGHHAHRAVMIIALSPLGFVKGFGPAAVTDGRETPISQQALARLCNHQPRSGVPG
jgi:hypothetical protein